MNRAAVIHRACSPYCYALNENDVIITVRTAKDVERVYIICEDPFIHELKRRREWFGEKREMELSMELGEYYLWSIKITPEYKRLKYCFELEAADEKCCLFENRICHISEMDSADKQHFKFPWLNPSDVISPPEWVKNTVWYQIMPDRYNRGSRFEKKDKFRDWGDLTNPCYRDVYGGTLRGITEKLDYLRELGVGGVYMTPIFLSPSDHKYDTIDYRQVDPDFGTEEDLRELINEAHSRGMRIMLDAVFNHCGLGFAPWQDVLKNGKASPYYKWFFINSDDFARPDFSTEDGRYFSFSFWSVMPKLNTNEPEVRRYFTDLVCYWAGELGIDGIRFDVGDEVSHTFVRELRQSVKAVKPDIYLLGEIWTDSITWLNGTEYDSVMNYPFPGAVHDFWDDKKLDSRELMYSINYCRSLYPRQITETLFNFLDTHDTPRAMERCENRDVLLQKLTILMTMPGTPCIYYGTEIALLGIHPPYNRQCMPWDSLGTIENSLFREKVSRLAAMRREIPEFSGFDMVFHHREENRRLIDYSKGNIRVIINAGEKETEIDTGKEVIFSNRLQDGKLLQYGTAIIRY